MSTRRKTQPDNEARIIGSTWSAAINRDTGLMDQWAYALEGWEEGREPTAWRWTDGLLADWQEARQKVAKQDQEARRRLRVPTRAGRHRRDESG